MWKFVSFSIWIDLSTLISQISLFSITRATHDTKSKAIFSDAPRPLARVFPVTVSWRPKANKIATDACPWGFAGVLFGKLQARGVVRCSTHRARSLQIQGQRRVVHAQHHLGSPRPPRGRCGHDCQVRGPWRASGVSHCHRSRAWCGSTATPPTSMLLPGNLPQTPSWACTQWGSRLTSGVYLADYLMICHGCGPLSHTFYRCPSSACHGNRLQIGIVGSGNPLLQSAGAEHRQENSHRRGAEASCVSRALLLVAALLTLRV